MRIGMAADHGGFELKERLAALLKEAGHDVVDFGPSALDPRTTIPILWFPWRGPRPEGKVERG